MVPIVKVPDRPDPRDAVPVAELAAQRITGVRRVGDHAARPYEVGDLNDRAPLRVGRMDVEVPGHATSLGHPPLSAPTGWVGRRRHRRQRKPPSGRTLPDADGNVTIRPDSVSYRGRAGVPASDRGHRSHVVDSVTKGPTSGTGDWAGGRGPG